MSLHTMFDPGPDLFGDRVFQVSELTAGIRMLLEAGFEDVAVLGEVSNLARPRSGHVYFNLKDERASIHAVMWKSTAARLVFDLTDGLAVRVRGKVSIYEPKSEYQLIVRSIEPEGVGALELAFRQLFARLEAEGLFDPARKRPLPRFPRRIVLVTSPTGAAVRDFLQVVGRRWPGVEVLIAPVRVQGEGAREEIAAAIALANRVAGADLIVLARGGGSLEDLWAFNEEIVARAIFASRLPVVSAVGHEVDVTIADHVADFRALTPSEAGERCVPDAAEFRERVGRLGERLARALRQGVEERRRELDVLAGRLARAGQEPIRGGRERLAGLSARLASAMRLDLERRAARLAAAVGRLEALSPLAVLGRGYSLTQDERGAILRDAKAVRPGSRILTRLARGALWSRVEEVRPETGP